MGKWVHRIIENNGSTGVCSNCGKVKLSPQGKCRVRLNLQNRKDKYRKKYGIEIDSTVIEDCAICGGNTRIAYDHNHKTGEFRGWLCMKCNTALGLADDNPKILQKMIDYLAA